MFGLSLTVLFLIGGAFVAGGVCVKTVPAFAKWLAARMGWFQGAAATVVKDASKL